APHVNRVTISSPWAIAPVRAWAVRNGIMQTYTLVADYGPGHDIEAAFIRAFKEAGGTVLGSVRYPVVNADFSPYVQRALDVKTPSIFYFVPGGAQPAALAKAFAERGVDPKKVRLLGSGEATAEPALKRLGDAALAIVTVYIYEVRKVGNELVNVPIDRVENVKDPVKARMK